MRGPSFFRSKIMSFCTNCGEELISKYLENEGMIPYCPHCGEYRFPMFNAAISAIVYNPAGDRVILIRQYGRDRNILVAGYINKGESAEHTLVREVKEELGLKVTAYTFNASQYFEKSNTLMINFACQVDSDSLEHMNQDEVDYAAWYTPQEAKEQILQGSLAQKFLLKWLGKSMYYGREDRKERRKILCYGDSNTYGYNPENGVRFPRDLRWTGRLQKLLGQDYEIVEEGCNGRTTVIADREEPWKSGESSLRAILNSHKPLDMVILMLGTNDMKKQYHASARDIASGVEELVDIIQTFTKVKQDHCPEILLVSPPTLRPGISHSPFGDSFSEDAIAVSEQLGSLYQEAAFKKGCHFVDAAGIIVSSEEDHLHLTAKEHEKLALALADYVQRIFKKEEP